MRIKSLSIENLRVIGELRLQPGPLLNLIVGTNGAGKTSLLEAIYLAGRGRTFRHVDAGPLIGRGGVATTVVIELERDGDRHKSSILGVRREKHALTCRLDGRDVTKRSELAETLPVQFVSSQPQSLLALGPDVRRRFIDMGVFHVEHSYLETLSGFQQSLRQRNAAIRQGIAAAVRPWSRPLDEAATKVNESRQAFVHVLLARAARLLRDWHADFVLSYRYRPGWPANTRLLDHLESRLEQDLRVGYTTAGPQRAELEFLANGVNAERSLSRGQQKILVLALNLALIDEVVSHGRGVPVLLIDDLAAELDPGNRERVIRELETRGVQVFLTAIEADALRPFSRDEIKMFHVEHGQLIP